MPPYTITTKFNCTKCQEDLTEVEMAYGLIICPVCGKQHTVHHTHIGEHGKAINTDITISLQAVSSAGINPLGSTIPIAKIGTQRKDPQDYSCYSLSKEK